MSIRLHPAPTATPRARTSPRVMLRVYRRGRRTSLTAAFSLWRNPPMSTPYERISARGSLRRRRVPPRRAATARATTAARCGGRQPRAARCASRGADAGARLRERGPRIACRCDAADAARRRSPRHRRQQTRTPVRRSSACSACRRPTCPRPIRTARSFNRASVRRRSRTSSASSIQLSPQRERSSRGTSRPGRRSTSASRAARSSAHRSSRRQLPSTRARSSSKAVNGVDRCERRRLRKGRWQARVVRMRTAFVRSRVRAGVAAPRSCARDDPDRARRGRGP